MQRPLWIGLHAPCFSQRRDVTFGLRPVHCCLRRGERGIVVGLRHLVGDIVGIDDPVLSVDDKDGSLQQSPFLQQHPIGLAEALVFVGGE